MADPVRSRFHVSLWRGGKIENAMVTASLASDDALNAARALLDHESGLQDGDRIEIVALHPAGRRP